MSKFLIINADDLGYNERQTKAIRELYSDGLISSTSLLTVTENSKKAASAAARDGFPTGLHLSINSDGETNCWQSNSGAKSLSDDLGLRRKQSDIALHAKRRDVRTELEAQYKFASSLGVKIDHADNHCATLYGINLRRFWIDAFDFCKEHSLPFRFPKSTAFFERQLGRAIPKPLEAYFGMIAAAGEKRGVCLLDDLVSDPRPFAKIKTYEETRKYYLDAVDNCIEGVTEMFLHPSYPIDDKESKWTKREYELRLLKSGDLLDRAKQKGVQIVSWSIFKEI